MTAWSSAVILGRCVHPGLVCRRQVAAVVGKQRGIRRAAHKDHDRSEGLCRVWPGHMEQPPHRPADFITVQRYICKKMQNSFIWLRALLRSSLIGHYTNWHIHSFIHLLQLLHILLLCILKALQNDACLSRKYLLKAGILHCGQRPHESIRVYYS